MRIYNVFLCPKCEHFEWRQPESFGHEKKAKAELQCLADKKRKELRVDPQYGDALKNPPPPCPDFELERRRAR